MNTGRGTSLSAGGGTIFEAKRKDKAGAASGTSSSSRGPVAATSGGRVSADKTAGPPAANGTASPSRPGCTCKAGSVPGVILATLAAFGRTGAGAATWTAGGGWDTRGAGVA